MSKFKAGDLALVVGCSINPENIGKVVEVTTRVLPGDIVECPDGITRLISKDANGPCWIVQGGNFISFTGRSWGMVNERYLMPLRGDFQPEQQKAKEVSV
ncbi:hypothetical protein ACKI1H_27095 [Pseudomonas sp. YH-1]|uniref:hypothetical protein n=1 Tax=Pseudomonas sp. YH-1 TaxID=3384787 RepID=UPI003F7F7832